MVNLVLDERVILILSDDEHDKIFHVRVDSHLDDVVVAECLVIVFKPVDVFELVHVLIGHHFLAGAIVL